MTFNVGPASGWTAAKIAFANLFFLLAATMMGHMPDLARSILVGALIFIIPGSAWLDLREGDAPSRIFWMVVKSLLISLAAWLALLPFPGATNRIAFLLVIAALTNLGFFLGIRRGWNQTTGGEPLSRFITIVAVLFFLQCYAAATRFVPVLEDQDMETQGTAYGLINHAAPTMATNRDTLHFFAHPLLLHYWIGESALISGDLHRLRYYHELATASGSPSPQHQWERSYQQFLSDPVLLPTRLPNMFLGAFLLFPLGFLVFRISGSSTAAAIACVVYATLPEVFVRNSYGGYMAVTNWLTISGAYFFLQGTGAIARPDEAGQVASSWKVPAMGALVAAALGSWADQKTILLPAAAAAFASWRGLVESGWKLSRTVFFRRDVIIALLVGLTFVLGWLGYVLYGISVSRTDFIKDHLLGHVVERLNMSNVNLIGTDKGEWVYPSVAGLWRQFLDHTGWLFALVLIGAIVRAARRSSQAEGLMLWWLVIGAVGFSLVDWRQTKHLAHILPPLVVLISIYWASLKGRAQQLASVLMFGAILWNVWRIIQLTRDFDYIRPLPIW